MESGGDPGIPVQREAALLQEMTRTASGPRLRFWKNSPCLVVGRQVSRWQGFDLAAKEMAAVGWPIVQRSTGGTIVPHYHGTLNISCIYPIHGGTRSFSKAYQMLCDPLLSAFRCLGVEADIGSVPGAYCDGDFNIRVNGQKLAGTAQQWKGVASDARKHVVLVHACLNTQDSELGVDVVNRFLERCSQSTPPEFIQPEAHTDLSTALEASGCRYEQPRLMETLMESFKSYASE